MKFPFQAAPQHPPVIGILRGFSAGDLEGIVAATRRGGLRHLEITMNSPDAAGQIARAAALAESEIDIGAGTVTSVEALEAALGAGATFIVTPIVVDAVIAACRDRGIAVLPGAYSPTEIVRAWELGATLVKVFPADNLGPGYCRALRGPLPHIPLVPTGGITLETLPGYRGLASAYGVGGPLFDPERIRARDWSWLEARCRAFAAAARTSS